MAIVVEHEKRRKEILERALQVFKDEGYDDVTLQKIADACGITRTTLYIYFKNKGEIFVWSIKQLTQEIEDSLKIIMDNKTMSNADKLRNMMNVALDKCLENRDLFDVLLAYLLKLQKSGKSPAERVRRRILRLRHLSSQVIIEGINSGEFKEINIRAANNLLYGMLESCVFRLSVMDEPDIVSLKESIDLAIDGIKA